jgi:hypothetical protein
MLLQETQRKIYLLSIQTAHHHHHHLFFFHFFLDKSYDSSCCQGHYSFKYSSIFSLVSRGFKKKNFRPVQSSAGLQRNMRQDGLLRIIES